MPRKYGRVHPSLFIPTCPLQAEPLDEAVLDEQNEALLSWGAVDGVDGYALFVWVADEAQPTEPTYTTTDVSYSVTGLDADTTYKWTVCAVVNNVLSVGCDQRTFVTAQEIPVELPGCPTLVSPNNGAGANVGDPITLTWLAGEGATSYNVYIDIHVDDFPFTAAPTTFVGNTSSLFWTINAPLIPAMLYAWRVRSVNEAGEGEECGWNYFTTGLADPGPECVAFVEGYAADPKSVRMNITGTGYSGNTDIGFTARDFPVEWSSPGVGHAVQTFGAWGATNAATGCQAGIDCPITGLEFAMPASGSSYTYSFPALTASSDFVLTRIIGFGGPSSAVNAMSLIIKIDGVEVAREDFDWTGPYTFLDLYPSNNTGEGEEQFEYLWRVFFVRIKWTNGMSAPDYVIIEPITISDVKDQYEP